MQKKQGPGVGGGGWGEGFHIRASCASHDTGRDPRRKSRLSRNKKCNKSRGLAREVLLPEPVGEGP